MFPKVGHTLGYVQPPPGHKSFRPELQLAISEAQGTISAREAAISDLEMKASELEAELQSVRRSRASVSEEVAAAEGVAQE